MTLNPLQLVTIMILSVTFAVLASSSYLRNGCVHRSKYMLKALPYRFDPKKQIVKNNTPIAQCIHILGARNVPRGNHHVVCISLWGTKKRYIKGAMETIKRCNTHLPGWMVRIYMPIDTYEMFGHKLADHGAQIHVMSSPTCTDYEGAMWRFRAIDGPPQFEGQRMISVDADDKLDNYILRWIRAWDARPDALFSYISAWGDFPLHVKAGRFGCRVGKTFPYSVMVMMKYVSTLNTVTTRYFCTRHAGNTSKRFRKRIHHWCTSVIPTHLF